MTTIINGSSPSITFSDGTTQATAGLVSGGTIASGTVTTLTSTTISDGTNSTSSTNCIQGSAKAWVNFNASSGAGVIRASYNVSSITYNATGNFTINFTTALTDSNYCAVFGAGRGAGDMNTGLNIWPAGTYSTTQLQVGGYYSTNVSAQNPVYCNVAVFR
jgi:hypothetical protein